MIVEEDVSCGGDSFMGLSLYICCAILYAQHYKNCTKDGSLGEGIGGRGVITSVPNVVLLLAHTDIEEVKKCVQHFLHFAEILSKAVAMLFIQPEYLFFISFAATPFSITLPVLFKKFLKVYLVS